MPIVLSLPQSNAYQALNLAELCQNDVRFSKILWPGRRVADPHTNYRNYILLHSVEIFKKMALIF